MKLCDIVMEMPISSFNTIGNFDKNSSFRKPADRRLLTNQKTVERAKTMFANTEFDFRMWFVNSPEANRTQNQKGSVDAAWMQQNMPQAFAEIQQQGGIGPQAINMIYLGNKGANWRPMTGWMMAHRMAHAVLAPLGGGLRDQPLDYIAQELLQSIQGILNAYEIDLGRARARDIFGARSSSVVLNLMKQLGTMKSARGGNVDSGYEFIYECFAQYLLTGQVKFNPLPDMLVTGYAGGRPQYRRVYGEVDRDQANDYAVYMADTLGQEFDRALHGVMGKIVVM